MFRILSEHDPHSGLAHLQHHMDFGNTSSQRHTASELLTLALVGQLGHLDGRPQTSANNPLADSPALPGRQASRCRILLGGFVTMSGTVQGRGHAQPGEVGRLVRRP